MTSATDGPHWNSAYVSGETRWDLGAANPVLTEALTHEPLLATPGRAFVPGGGRGHDAHALSEAGWDVVEIDVSAQAIDYLTAHYPAVKGIAGDALDPDFALAQLGEPVDLLWDHTFFCALSPAARPRVGELARAVVKPGGLVASCVFPIGRLDAGGPPYRYQVEDMTAVLDGFELVSQGPEVVRPGWDWLQRLGIWRRAQDVSPEH